MFETPVDRRNFLRGSTLFAAALGLKFAVPAAAQQEQDEDQSKPKPQEKKGSVQRGQGQERREDLHRPGRSGVPGYARSAPTNMYKQGRMWVCDNCGYSYVE